VAGSTVLRGSIAFRDASVRRFHADLRRVASELERQMLVIAGKLRQQGAFFRSDAADVARLAVARREIAQALKESGYEEAVGRLLGSRSRLAREVQREYRRLSGTDIAFARPDLDAFAAISGAQFDAFAELGDEAVNALRRGLQRAVTTGESWESWTETLRDAMRTAEGGSPVALRAAETLARTATTQLHRVMQRRMDEELGVEAWVYVGPDDEVTRPFCTALLDDAADGKTWSEDEIDELDNSKENGGAGAGPGSAREQGGGWNCRHIWEPLLPDEESARAAGGGETEEDEEAAAAAAPAVQAAPERPPVELPKVPRQWEDRVNPVISRRVRLLANDHGMDTEDYIDAAVGKTRELTKNAHVFTRIDPEALDAVLADGRFKTQYETETSNGLFDPDARRAFEHNFFGAPLDLPNEQRPIYGFLSSFDDGSDGAVDHYGGVVVRFKDGVRGRTTWNEGDSLDSNSLAAGWSWGGEANNMASPLERPDWRSFQYEGDPLSVRTITDMVREAPETPYMEAQLWGGVRVDDIQYVVVSPKEDPAWVNSLRARGLNVRVANSGSS
jgi:hypothetical protein